jgi:hypothetical protein
MITMSKTLAIVIPDLIRYPEFTFWSVNLDAGSSPASRLRKVSYSKNEPYIAAE